MTGNTPRMTNAALETLLSRLRVLLVDDNAALRGALRVSLQAFGCAEVVETDSVDRALAEIETGRIDLVITDWKMSPRDGLDLVRNLRAPETGAAPDLPILMLSAYCDAERISAAHAAGVTAFLNKPFTAASLAATLSEALLAGPSGQSNQHPDRNGDRRCHAHDDRTPLACAN